MKHEHFVIHLEGQGCSFIRELASGYSAYRGPKGKKSGIPQPDNDGNIEDATVYLACRCLEIVVPNEVANKGLFEVGADNYPLPGPLIILRKEKE